MLILLAPSLVSASDLVNLDFDGVDIKILTEIVSDIKKKPVMYCEGFSGEVRLVSTTPVKPQVFFNLYGELIRELGYNVFEFRNHMMISRQVGFHPEPRGMEGHEPQGVKTWQ